MIRRLINRLQGKVWAANCNMCLWCTGTHELTRLQAFNRAKLHSKTSHNGLGNLLEMDKFKAVVVRLPFYL